MGIVCVQPVAHWTAYEQQLTPAATSKWSIRVVSAFSYSGSFQGQSKIYVPNDGEIVLR